MAENLDCIMSCMVITSPLQTGHPVVFATKGFAEMVGCHREELLGKSIFQVRQTSQTRPAPCCICILCVLTTPLQSGAHSNNATSCTVVLQSPLRLAICIFDCLAGSGRIRSSPEYHCALLLICNVWHSVVTCRSCCDDELTCRF